MGPLCAHFIQFLKSQINLLKSGVYLKLNYRTQFADYIREVDHHHHIIPPTLMLLVSLISLSMSEASPLSLDGSCWRMVPSPAQLYRLMDGFPPAAPERYTQNNKRSKFITNSVLIFPRQRCVHQPLHWYCSMRLVAWDLTRLACQMQKLTAFGGC